MKKTLRAVGTVLLAVCLLLTMAACGGITETTQPNANAADVFQALLKNVKFDTQISDVGTSANSFFLDLPEYAIVTMYSGSGYYADELTWITLASADQMDVAQKSVESHLKQLHDQFLSYIPEELDKIDNAVIWTSGANLIVCITNDYKNANAIIADPANFQLTPVTTQGTAANETTTPASPLPTGTTAPDTTVPNTTAPVYDPDVVLNADGYPAITSQSSEPRYYNAACIVDNMAYEYFGYSTSVAERYAQLVSRVANDLQGKTDVYCLIIPTAIGVVFPDNIRANYKNYEYQGQRMDSIYAMMDSTVTPVNCFERLMRHRNEYLYFRTDWHWTALGAYYAYEQFCQVKGITPYTTQQRKLTEFDNYLGGLYWQTCSKDSALSATPDVVQAYHPFSENAYMYFTDRNGTRYSWNIITDVSGYDSSYKYNTFAAADQPFAEFYNPDVTDGSVAIVIKESFGNAFMPYVVDHYSTVYEIDYRYWSGDIVEFAKEKGVDDIIFCNNIGMVCDSYRVGLMDKIIPD